MTIDNLFDALTESALDGDEYLDHRDGAITIEGTFDADTLIRALTQ